VSSEDSCKIFGSVRLNENKNWRIRLNVKNLECTNSGNSYHENPPKRRLGWYFELISVENKMQLESESSSRK